MIKNWFPELARSFTAVLLTAACVLTAARAQAADAPLVFAAASLSDALTEVAATLDPSPRLSFAGSGAIARQIDQGAPADVVLLASPLWMDWLEQRGHLQAGTRSAPFGNRLVLVGPPDAAPLTELSAASLTERLSPSGRLAMGEHRGVPAGQYAFQWLRSKNLWEPLLPYIAETENVRAALALVTRGEAPLGLVYASDLVASPDAATEVWTIPKHEQPDIRYALAAITPQGEALVQALSAPDALAVFARYGFDITGSE